MRCLQEATGRYIAALQFLSKVREIRERCANCEIGAEHIYVDSCFFDQPGGNGLFLSNYAVRCRVTNNEFYSMGDSAVLAVGVLRLNNEG
jgi:hypothetical protein